MRDPLKKWKKPRRGFGMLEIDSAVDTGLYRFFTRLREGYERFSTFMWRFRARGAKRVLAEAGSEGFTLGVGGALVVLAFAIPAFHETRQDWMAQADYSITFLDRYGSEIGKRGILHNDSVPLEEMPDHLIRAVLATEDRRFYSHFGIDIPGTFRAVLANARANHVVQGGSSLTQQLAKNLFLTSERTLERKIKEAFLALWLEARLSKDEIFKLYLDRAYMGGGTFGVDAAAQFYFGKSVRDVNLAEAAMLAGLFKAPTRFAPHVNLPAARGRANEVLTNLVHSGLMTEGQVHAARRRPAEAVNHDGEDVPNYFLDWAFAEIKRIDPPKDTALTVKTTLDLGIQKTADQAVESSLRQYSEQHRVKQAAMVLMEPDGAVRAMVGGRDYGESQFNRAVNAQRQPGSSFKTYVYAAALAEGYTPRSVVQDAPISIGGWSPQNYTRSFAGNVTLTTALARSINTVPVRLAQAIGRDKIIDTAYKMGIKSELRMTRSLPLGPSEVTVLDQATGYATLANGGRQARPHAIAEIRDGQGNLVYHRGRDETEAEQVLSPQVAADLNVMLNQAVEAGTGGRAQLSGIKVSGKTGTSQSYRDAWFIGYTGNYVGAVWFGNDDFTTMRRMTGGSVPAMTWQKVMAYAHQGIELQPIPGVAPFADGPAVAAVEQEGGPDVVARRPISLSARSVGVLGRIENHFRSAPNLAPTASGRPPVSSTMFRGSTSFADGAWSTATPRED